MDDRRWTMGSGQRRLDPIVHRPKRVSVKDIQVSSWNELNEQVFEGSWNAQIARFRSNLAFRGMPDSRYDLKTSLIQLGGDFGSHEADLLRNFRKYAYRNAA